MVRCDDTMVASVSPVRPDLQGDAMSVATMSGGSSATPQTGRAARLAPRTGQFKGATAGVAPGFVQGNLAILPNALAGDFLRFCQLNPKPCPLLAASSPGDFRLPTLADDLDIRTDLPRYRVFRQGELVDEPADIRGHWRDDLVAFVLGCSFSFEEALIEDGIELRHITCNATVPMYRTAIATAAAGPFHGPMVVSMRPMKPADAIRAIPIPPRFPAVHGAPVHIGKPALRGSPGGGREARRTPPDPSRSPRASPPCTARRCISASPSSSASPTWAS